MTEFQQLNMALEAKKFKVFTEKVEQEKATDFINKNDIEILLVGSATKAKKDLIDKCPNLKIIGRRRRNGQH